MNDDLRILPDLLLPGLKAVFCGTAAGTASARRGLYYAGRGNRFLEVLYHVGLIPRQLTPEDYHELLSYGIGLTDLVKDQAGMDNQLQMLNSGREALLEKITRYTCALTASGPPRFIID